MLLALDPDVKRYFTPPDLHEAARERRAGLGVTLLLSLILTLLYTVIFFGVMQQRLTVELALTLHLFLAASAMLLTYSLIRRGRDARFAILLSLTTLTCAIFGAAGTMLACVLTIFHRRYAQSFLSWFDSIFPIHRPTHPERIHEGLITGRDEAGERYGVQPFADIIAYGSETQKREALSKMATSFDARFAPLFQAALSDPSNTIRVQAATALTRVENLFHDRLMKLTRALGNAPNDPGLIFALASHADAYAFTGILDTGRERQNRQLAETLYRQCIQTMPSHAGARVKLGRLYLREGRAADAANWFEACEKDGYLTPEMIPWRLEALYASGRFAALRTQACVSIIGESAAALPELQESVALWAREHAA